jgi:hypothetical protein
MLKFVLTDLANVWLEKLKEKKPNLVIFINAVGSGKRSRKGGKGERRKVKEEGNQG